MGSTNDKIAYLNTTKELIKNKINDLGGELNNQDSFREYSNLLDTIYEEYPKINDTNKNIALQNTNAGKMKIELNSTELIQDGTPDPENPIEINVITGSNNVKVENKNLLNIANYNGSINNLTIKSENQQITIDGIANSGTYTWIVITKDNFFTRNGTPSASTIVDYANGKIISTGIVSKLKEVISGTSTVDLAINLYDENGAVVSTPIETTKIIAVGIYLGNAQTFNNYKFGLQLEQGLTTTYVPHQEQNYPITLNSDNLLNLPTKLVETTAHGLTFTPVYAGNTLLYINVNGTANADTDYYIVTTSKRLTLPAGSYLFSSGVDGSNNTYFINFSARNLSVISNYSGNTSITINNSDDFWFLIKVRSGVTMDNVKFKPFMRVSTSTSEYVPYIPNPTEYCKIGDYADQFFKNTIDSEFYDSTLLENEWYLKKNINKVVLDGSENWLSAGTFSGFYAYYLTITNAIPVGQDASPLFKSDKFHYVNGTSQANEGGAYMVARNFLIFVTENTVSDLKTWLSNHNTVVYYILETPQYIQISQEDYPVLQPQLDNLYNNAQSYNGETNIIQINDDLSFIIKATALMGGDE